MTGLLFIYLLILGGSLEGIIKPSQLENNHLKVKSKQQVIEKEAEIVKPIRVKALTNEIMEDDTVEAVIEDRHYTLYPDGKIAVKWISNNYSDTFHLDTERIIQTAYFLDFKEDLIIYYTDTDFETGSSSIECYDRKTNDMKWKNRINGFNLTTPIVVENMTYVATMGFIGKLNLDNGQYHWKYDNLYKKTRFDSFGSIEIAAGKVNFIEGLWVRDTKKPGRIIINDKTGEIEKIIKNAP